MTIVPWHNNVQRKNTLTYSVKAMGGQWTAVLDKAVAEFNRQMSQHGLKLTLSKVEKGMGPHLVTIRVPATPRVNPNDPKSPEVGPGVRLCLLVHELIHAVGLSNNEHSPDDVFAGKSVVIPKGQYLRSRKQAAEDMVQPPDGSAPMPPIRLGPKTVANLKRAWTGG